MIAVYRRVFALGLQDTFVYRWNFVLRSLFSIIPLVGTVFVWRAVCTQGTGLTEYNLSAMVFYFVGVMVVDRVSVSVGEEDMEKEEEPHWEVLGVPVPGA